MTGAGRDGGPSRSSLGAIKTGAGRAAGTGRPVGVGSTLRPPAEPGQRSATPSAARNPWAAGAGDGKTRRPMGAVLEGKGLAKSFAELRAVDGVDLTIAAGERVALLGPNGAGKTTTLLMLLGAITPDAGTISIVGHELPEGPVGGHARGRVRGRLPPAARAAAGAGGPLRVRRLLRAAPQGRRRGRRRRPRALRGDAPRRPHVHGALVGPADPGGHREGRPPPAVAPRPGRANRQPGSRRRPPRPGQPARHRGQRRHRPARHQPQHARGGAALRAGRLPGRRPGRRRRRARRGGGALRPRRPRGRVPAPRRHGPRRGPGHRPRARSRRAA